MQYSNEIYHHGILGQKWGVRRYQNPDGSLTPAGRRRLAKDEYKLAIGKANQTYDKKLSSIKKSNKPTKSVEISKAKEEFNKSVSEAYATYRKANNEIKMDSKKAKEETKAPKKDIAEKKEKGKDFAKAFLLTAGVVGASLLFNRPQTKNEESGEETATGTADKKSESEKTKKNKNSKEKTSSSPSEEIVRAFVDYDYGNIGKSVPEKVSKILPDIEGTFRDITDMGSTFVSNILSLGTSTKIPALGSSQTSLIPSSSESSISLTGSTPIAYLLPPKKD